MPKKGRTAFDVALAVGAPAIALRELADPSLLPLHKLLLQLLLPRLWRIAVRFAIDSAPRPRVMFLSLRGLPQKPPEGHLAPNWHSCLNFWSRVQVVVPAPPSLPKRSAIPPKLRQRVSRQQGHRRPNTWQEHAERVSTPTQVNHTSACNETSGVQKGIGGTRLRCVTEE